MTKNIFVAFGFFALLLVSLTMVSAYGHTSNNISVNTLTELQNPVVPGTSYDILIEVVNGNTIDIDLAWADTAATSGITITVPSDSTLAADTTKNYTITYIIPAGFEGTDIEHKVDLIANNGTVDTTFHPYSPATYTVITSITGCMDSTANNYDSTATVAGTCTYDNKETACEFDFNVVEGTGRLEIVDFDIQNNGNGDDETWNYMDSIEFEVEVENTDNDDSISDVEVEVIIMTQDDDGNWTVDATDDFDFEDEIITSMGKIKKDDKETVTFEIKELSSDVAEGDYRLYIVAYSDGDEENNCVSEYNDNDFKDDRYFEFDVEGVNYEDSIVVKESFLKTSIDTFCGERNVEITIPIYNLYEDDEEMVLINIYNNELGIDEYRTIEDLRDGKHEEITFFVSIPETLDKTKYDLDIYVHFDWDDDEDENSELADEEKNTVSIDINSLGCKVVAPSIKPTLDSVTVEGTELVVKTIITNNGDDNDFKIMATGYESWATIVSVTPETASIKEGEFIEATIVLMPTTSGMHSFKITATVGDDTFNQLVSVNIKESSFTFGLDGTTLYLVAGIGGMLVLILLVLIVKIAKRKPVKANF